jgi:hypothetical protein
MAYVDDNNNIIHYQDVDFFFDEFTKLAKPRGCNLNALKTRILTSTNGSSPLPQLQLTNPQLATSVQSAINKYSITKAATPDAPPVPVELLDGFRLLGAPVGSPSFARQFCLEQAAAAFEAANKLTTSVPDLQTRLRLFAQCTIQKLPHLLGYDVMHHLPLTHPMAGLGWESFEGPLIDCTNNLIATFFKQLLQLPTSLPQHSLFIAQLGLSQGGLGLIRPTARAIPDFVLTMAKATNYATQGISFHREAPNILLPTHICALYSQDSNPHSLTLQRFQYALPTIACVAVSHHIPTNQRVDHFLSRTSTNSARARLRLHEPNHASPCHIRNSFRPPTPPPRRFISAYVAPPHPYVP